jgi:hypothetical protein
MGRTTAYGTPVIAGSGQVREDPPGGFEEGGATTVDPPRDFDPRPGRRPAAVANTTESVDLGVQRLGAITARPRATGTITATRTMPAYSPPVPKKLKVAIAAALALVVGLAILALSLT